MKYSQAFEMYLGCLNTAEVFRYLQNTLIKSIMMWDYLVNWEKVLGNIRDIEIGLNTLNYLVGRQDMEEAFKYLLKQQQQLYRFIPILLASRDTDFEILTEFGVDRLVHKDFSFKNKKQLTNQDIDNAFVFAKETGLLELFANKTIKSVPDYVIGIETGLDSNARKNRSGSTMETIIEGTLASICEHNGFQMMTQGTAAKLRSRWGVNIEVDKAQRRFDFAVKNQDALYLFETNYYGGGGSKLKATAGEYKSLFDLVTKKGDRFIWITDGLGWKTAISPLEETFIHIDYTFNLEMVSTGLLAHIITHKL